MSIEYYNIYVYLNYLKVDKYILCLLLKIFQDANHVDGVITIIVGIFKKFFFSPRDLTYLVSIKYLHVIKDDDNDIIKSVCYGNHSF